MPSSKAAAKSSRKSSKNIEDASTATVNEVADDASDRDDTVTMDRRREERRQGDAEATDTGVAGTPRRKKQRRRHIDPTTCERDYTDDEVEFMRAMDDYKRKSGRMFPTCSEVLEVVRELGYFRLNDDQQEQLGLVEFIDEIDDVENADAEGEEEDWEEAVEA